MIPRFLSLTLALALSLILAQTLLWAPAGASELQDLLLDRYDIAATGFLEARYGERIHNDPYEEDTSIQELRLQLGLDKETDFAVFSFKGDLTADGVEDKVAGEIRELNAGFTPLSWMDVKLGRQVMTWGTGDLLFINDLFPKDWESFFSGRDDEYLKAPSDAVKVSIFSPVVNLDLVYVPLFAPSRYIDGSRLSYWNGMTGSLAGSNAIMDDEERNSWFRDDELSLRLSRRVGSVELAAYGYYGYWKTPEGVDSATRNLFYPKLAAYGASLRTPFLKGVANLEAGYYDSRDDRSGDDPMVRNSETRFLAGYEQELLPDLTLGLQYYLEWMSDYDAYEQSLGSGATRDEFRHLLTVRLTKLLLNQTLRLSLFTYYSPSDRDVYLRPKANYKLTDNWALETGANIFAGSNDYSFFGQFENDSNIFFSARRSF